MTAYVIPPVNAAAVKAQTSRFGITDAMLIYSSIPEAPPPAYNAGTIYGAGVEVSWGAVGGDIAVWLSLKGGNQGKPLVEGEWWTFSGNTYAEWNAAVAYAQGALVLRTNTHRTYKRVVAGSSPQAPEDDLTGVNWVEWGTTNRWAMFDMMDAVPSILPLNAIVHIAPGRISSLSFINTDAGDVTMTMKDGGVTVWPPVSQSLDTTPIESWEDYFFAEFALQSNVVRLDVPTYTNGVLEISISSGAVARLGWLVVGTATALGETKYGAKVRRKTYSEVERNKSGELSNIVTGKRVPLISQSMYAAKGIVLKAMAALDFADRCPCVYVGLDDDSDVYAEMLTFVGICQDDQYDLENSQECSVSLEVEGV